MEGGGVGGEGSVKSEVLKGFKYMCRINTRGLLVKLSSGRAWGGCGKMGWWWIVTAGRGC